MIIGRPADGPDHAPSVPQLSAEPATESAVHGRSRTYMVAGRQPARPVTVGAATARPAA